MMTNLNRRDVLRMIAFSCTLLVLPSCAALGDPGGGKKPNIVYILADDLGYGDLTCQNEDSKIPTPNMDRLAEEGMRFTDAHSGSAVCTPTRYGLLTGRYAWRTRLKSGVLWGYSPPLIESSRVTVASFLQIHGYTCACVGKWHLGLGWATKEGQMYNDRPDEKGKGIDYSKPIQGGPLALGFDYFYGIPASLDMIPYVYIENDRVEAPASEKIKGRGGLAFYRGGPAAPGFDHTETLPRLTEKAVAFIDDHQAKAPKKPFFLYFPLTAPHTPVLPTDDLKGKSQAGDYGDFVVEVDWTVGEVMKALKRHGIEENTLVIVTSDNGSTMKPMMEYDHLPSHYLRGRKSDAWDGGHRAPFIVRWPEHIEAGSTCEKTLCHTDLLATCADLVGHDLPPGAGEDSYSFLHALEGRPGPERAAVIHHSISGMFAIRKGEWKMIEGRGSGGWTRGGKDDPAPGQLYNMKDDVEEKNNLYLKRLDKVAELQALLDTIRGQ
jgi:arylsulfatase A-like enzyme